MYERKHEMEKQNRIDKLLHKMTRDCESNNSQLLVDNQTTVKVVEINVLVFRVLVCPTCILNREFFLSINKAYTYFIVYAFYPKITIQ